MAGAYSQDLRKRVIATIEAGASCRTAASRFAVSVSTVVNWRRRWLDTGTAAAKPMGGATNTRIKDEDATWLLALVAAQDDLTLHAMQARLREERGVRAAIGSIWRFLKANKITLKKKTLTPVEQDRPDVAASRAAWLETQPALDPSRLIFIDETWAKTNMTRRYGRARRGRRVCAESPMAAGERRPSSPVCDTMGSSLPSSSMGRSMARVSLTMSLRSLSPNSGQGTSSSSIISAATKAKRSRPQSRLPVRP